MISVFVVAIIGYATNYTTDNDSVINPSNDDRLSTSVLTEDLDNSVSLTNQSSDNYAKLTLESGDQSSTSGGVFKGLTGPYNSVKQIFSMGSSVLGNSIVKIALTALGSFLAIVIMLYTWKTWGGRNPD